MKKNVLIITLLMVLTSPLASAQQVKVTYSEEYKVTKEMEPQMANPQVAQLVKEQLAQMATKSVLYYANGESLYQTEKKQTEKQDNVIVHTLGEVGAVYKDQKIQEVISEESIIDRQFLVTEKMPTVKWTLDNETRKIGQYTCRKAHTDTGTIAWYCPDIEVKDGPSIYCGLPGLILEVELQSKKYVMQDIDLNYKGSITKPTKGKKITREEYAELRDKKMKEFNVGSGGSVKVVKM